MVVWRLLADRFAPEVATGAVLLLAFCPPAYVFSLAYSEPLFRNVDSLADPQRPAHTAILVAGIPLVGSSHRDVSPWSPAAQSGRRWSATMNRISIRVAANSGPPRWVHREEHNLGAVPSLP
jgi:hypothetical protein